MAEPFTQGNPEFVRKLNLMVREVNSLKRMQGDPFIRVESNDAGTTFRLNMGEVIKRIPRYRGSGGGIRRAFVKTAPGATTTLVCFLDVDTTGTEINVVCTIYGGGNLNEAHPSFVDGDELWVAFNTIADEWQNVTRIDGSEECEV